MNNKKGKAHTFHIPVMGLGFTLDTPLKVAPYGISSAISLVDDMLIERMREFYSKKFNLPFQSITAGNKDHRAQRITSYLNLVDQLVKEKFEEVKQSFQEKSSEFSKYMELLPDCASMKQEFNQAMNNNTFLRDAKNWIQSNLMQGSIDVNIMTKLDKANYFKGELLPDEYNDAHAALRGFAESKLDSALVLSAGMNPRLYSYLENFKDFFPDENGKLKKRIILKVSDYRSALIQGKFLAKKGIWISEYRVESGLNCGGHAFGSDGYLLGPILEEFKNSRDTLIQSIHEVLIQALQAKGLYVPEQPMAVKITAQGGVGTADEHQFLMDYYQLDSVGWGTPFLLVPEAASIDQGTIELLSEAKEDDLYLSNISPLGVKFNSLRTNTMDIDRAARIASGKPGSPCTKQYALLNKEFTEKPICTASRQYQKLKLAELDAKGLDAEAYQKAFDQIVDKSCICLGLGNATLLANEMDTRMEGTGVSVCPGPNMAYFSRKASLKEMVDHIYGRLNLIERKDRPHMFIKELALYIEFLKNRMEELKTPIAGKDLKYVNTFRKNVTEGIVYYKSLFADFSDKFNQMKQDMDQELEALEARLNMLFPALT